MQMHHSNNPQRVSIRPVNNSVREPLQADLASVPVKSPPHPGRGLNLGNGNISRSQKPLTQFIIHTAIVESSLFQLEDCGFVPKDVHADFAALWAASF